MARRCCIGGANTRAARNHNRVSGRPHRHSEKALAVLPNSNMAVQAVGAAVLIPDAGPNAQPVAAKELKVNFPFLGWSKESRPVRPVHHDDDPASTTDRLASGDPLHF